MCVCVGVVCSEYNMAGCVCVHLQVCAVNTIWLGACVCVSAGVVCSEYNMAGCVCVCVSAGVVCREYNMAGCVCVCRCGVQ